jgi:hypothetical protein
VTALAMSCALFGTALGIRFKFFILFPTLMIGLVFIVGFSIAQELAFLQALFTIIVFGCFLQFGYLIGAVLKHTLGLASQPRLDGSKASVRS